MKIVSISPKKSVVAANCGLRPSDTLHICTISLKKGLYHVHEHIHPNPHEALFLQIKQRRSAPGYITVDYIHPESHPPLHNHPPYLRDCFPRGDSWKSGRIEAGTVPGTVSEIAPANFCERVPNKDEVGGRRGSARERSTPETLTQPKIRREPSRKNPTSSTHCSVRHTPT